MPLTLSPAGISKLLDRSLRLAGQPFSATHNNLAGPHGRIGVVHHGLMLPDLPEPIRYLDFITILGQPQIPMFRNQSAFDGSGKDIATVLISSALPAGHQLHTLNMHRDCDFRADGSLMRFGDILTIEGSYPRYRICANTQSLSFDLALVAEPQYSHFMQLPFGTMNHWSLHCRYQGSLRYGNQQWQLKGHCSLECARAINARLPLSFFTYQIINLDARSQLLLAEVRDGFGGVLQRRLYIRTLGEISEVFDSGVSFTVQETQPITRTPNNIAMALPRRFEWQLNNRQGDVLLHLQCTSNDDYRFGLAAGYVGSFQYQGELRGKSFAGHAGYIEYVDYQKK